MTPLSEIIAQIIEEIKSKPKPQPKGRKKRKAQGAHPEPFKTKIHTFAKR